MDAKVDLNKSLDVNKFNGVDAKVNVNKRLRQSIADKLFTSGSL